MIPVEAKPEPQRFDRCVRQPGSAFLEGGGAHGRSLPAYWTRVHSDLRSSYRGICAYTCISVVRGTLDHFLPKSKYRQLAYEWTNYRLASERANQSKSNKVGLIDPFDIRGDWFAIRLPQCDVIIGPALPEEKRRDAEYTIHALDLNDEYLVQHRSNIAVEFRDEKVCLDHVRRYYPFLATEIERQGEAAGAMGEASLRNYVAKIFRDFPSTR